MSVKEGCFPYCPVCSFAEVLPELVGSRLSIAYRQGQAPVPVHGEVARLVAGAFAALTARLAQVSACEVSIQ